MDVTVQLITRLRKMLNEPIPVDGTDANTNFLDAELSDLLTEADNVYQAASAGWTEKAGLLQGQIESYNIGEEKYDLTSLKDRLNHALSMSRQYATLGQTQAETAVPQRSRMMRVSRPEVL